MWFPHQHIGYSCSFLERQVSFFGGRVIIFKLATTIYIFKTKQYDGAHHHAAARPYYGLLNIRPIWAGSDRLALQLSPCSGAVEVLWQSGGATTMKLPLLLSVRCCSQVEPCLQALQWSTASYSALKWPGRRSHQERHQMRLKRTVASCLHSDAYLECFLC